MNVIDVLNDRGLLYKEAGKDYVIRCLNPEHEDRHPSLRIDKVTGIFHCLSCGYKGNIFEFYGAEPNYIDIEVAKLKNKIRDILSKTRLNMPLDAVPFCRDYRGISGNIYMEVNAFTSNEKDEFKDRLMFPLYDISGNIRVFVGRSLHSDVKSKYLFYPKHVTPPLFPAHPEVWKNSLIIVEGIFDALNLMDKGCYNVVCAFGTNTLLHNYKERLGHFKILGVNKLFILFDGDKAGNDASMKLENKINEEKVFSADSLILGEGTDPGDLTEENIKNLMIGLYGNG
jgi:DNA primase